MAVSLALKQLTNKHIEQTKTFITSLPLAVLADLNVRCELLPASFCYVIH